MDKLAGWITLVIGILLLLPLIGVDQIGTITEGVTAWLITIGVLVIAIKGLFVK